MKTDLFHIYHSQLRVWCFHCTCIHVFNVTLTQVIIDPKKKKIDPKITKYRKKSLKENTYKYYY